VFFLSATIDKNAPPYLCSIPYIYQLSCTDGTKTLYFENLARVADMAVDEACNLYACMGNKLVKFTPPHDSITIRESSKIFSSIVTNSEGKIWAGTYGDGLYYYDTHVWNRYSSHNSNLSGNSISRVETGKDNSIWLSVEGDTSSLTHIADGVFTTYKWKDLIGKNISYLFQLAVDKTGKAWVCYNSENSIKLATLSQNGELTILTPEFIGENTITRLRSDYNGDIYLIINTGSRSKLYLYDNSSWNEIFVSEVDSYIHDATIDANQNLWLGMQKGLLKTTKE
jgi:ligand-binding sensor domain-containing protein